MKRLRLAGREWTVRIVSPRHPALMDDEEEVHGATVQAESTIYLSSELGPKARRFYLVHEALHAILEGSGGSHELGRKCKSRRAHDRLEERTVRALVPGVLDLFTCLKGRTE